MLKLKYLFDNTELATMLVKNWKFDSSSLDLFKDYRISSNAVYPFKSSDKLHYLRFAPASEKNIVNLRAERDFVSYLGKHQYPALKYKSSQHGKDIESVGTPWGNYHASVFEGVDGISLEDIELTLEIAEQYGWYLGSLHKLSAQYTPVADKRWSYEDVLIWIEDELAYFENEALAKREARILEDALAKLPKSSNTFGLIHYDFEMDNIFHNPIKGVMSVIDFDDAMYSWYAMDIEQVMDNIANAAGGDRFTRLWTCFLEGYRQAFDVADEMLSHMPLFRRFIDLYGYTRIIRATADHWANEPEWMVRLRCKLNSHVTVRSRNFGQPF